MNAWVVEWLACPADFRALQLLGTPASSGSIAEGELRCASCGCSYRVIAGIPCLIGSADDALSELQQHEQQMREGEYGRNERYVSEIERLPEIDAVRSALGDCAGLNVLDAGCGIGEMTRLAQDAARVVAVDFSRAGLLGHSLRGAPSVELIQADVSRLPLRDALFDAAMSTGVFHHLTTEAQRGLFLAHVRRALRPGGRFVLTTFNYNAHHGRTGVPKEGFFDNGIFRRRFEPGELRDELAKHFAVDAIVPAEICLPKTYRLVKALGRRNVAWDRFWRRRAFTVGYSNLLLAVCRRPRVVGQH